MGTYLCLCVHTDRQTDRQTDRRTERQTKMHTCMYTYIQTYIHTHAYCSVLRCPDVMNAPFCFFPSPPDTLTSPICCRSRRWSNFSKSAPKTRRSRKLHTHARAHTHAHTHTHPHMHTYIHTWRSRCFLVQPYLHPPPRTRQFSPSASSHTKP